MNERAGRWFDIRRPENRADLLLSHLPWAALTGLVLAAASFFPFREHRVINCMFRRTTGWPCPSCGYTRAFCDIAHGDFAAAWHEAPASLLLFAGVVLVFLWHAAALVSGRRIRRGPRLRPPPRVEAILWGTAIAIYLANWIYRLTSGLV